MTTEDISITSQERQIVDLVKEKGSMSIDSLYSEIYRQRIFGRSWLIRNSLRRLHNFRLIAIHQNRIFIINNGRRGLEWKREMD